MKLFCIYYFVFASYTKLVLSNVEGFRIFSIWPLAMIENDFGKGIKKIYRGKILINSCSTAMQNLTCFIILIYHRIIIKRIHVVECATRQVQRTMQLMYTSLSQVYHSLNKRRNSSSIRFVFAFPRSTFAAD